MSRRIQTGSSIRRKSHHIGSEIRPKRIADVVGLRILADEDWKETGEELKKKRIRSIVLKNHINGT